MLSFSRAAFGNDFLQSKYGISDTQSGFLVGAVSLSSVILSPASGLFLDKFGGSEYVAFICMLFSVLAFLLLGFTKAYVVPVIVLAGICYGVLPSALYPLLAEAVPEDSFPQVYAILTSAINLVLSVSTLLAGRLSTPRSVPLPDVNSTLPAEFLRFDDISVLVHSVVNASRTGADSATSSHARSLQYATEADSKKPDYTYVFVLFTFYVSIGTVVTGYVAAKKLRDTLIERRRAAIAARLDELSRPADALLPVVRPLRRGNSVLGIELQETRHDVDSVDDEGHAKAETVAVALRLF